MASLRSSRCCQVSPRRTAVAFAALGLCVVGCNTAPSEKLVPASGTATLDGKPFAGAEVGFLPDSGDAPAVRAPVSANLDAQGKFELRTGPTVGAPAGRYKVVVVESLNPPAGADPAKPAPNPQPVPPVYSDPAKTPLRVEVPAGGTTTLQLELRSK